MEHISAKDRLNAVFEKYLNELHFSDLHRLSTILYPSNEVGTPQRLIQMNLIKEYKSRLVKNIYLSNESVEAEVLKIAEQLSKSGYEVIRKMLNDGLISVMRAAFFDEAHMDFDFSFLTTDITRQTNELIDSTIKLSPQIKKNLQIRQENKSRKASEIFKIPLTVHDMVYKNGAIVTCKCYCEQAIDQNVVSPESYMQCILCHTNFHLKCLSYSKTSGYCPTCQLKLMLPNRIVRKVLYAGILIRERKNHRITFSLTSQELVSKFRVQIRACRLAEKTKNFILFPDSGVLRINNSIIKDFKPLHKQSSIKYRKDDPIYIPNGYLQRENVIYFNEKAGNESVDRIQPFNHIIGIYLVEERKNEEILREIEYSNMTSFQQSRQLLLSIYSTNSSDLTFERLRIPMTCILSLDRLKYPGRGALCRHFQCFDILNYLMLVSSTVSPRWVCPICKQPAYCLKVDTIMTAILNKYPQELVEVLFTEKGDFTLKMKDSAMGKHQQISIESSIYQLSIEDMHKRMPTEPLPMQTRNKFVIPQGVDIIPIDQ